MWVGSYLLYSCVGIQTGRFVCSVLTLEAAMSKEVHSRCSRMLDYERAWWNPLHEDEEESSMDE